jgi:hypothetical protein
VKSQSLRRLIAFANVGLVLGVAGFAGWYFVKLRPAAAEGLKRVSWVKKAHDDHQADAGNAHKVTHWQVDENDFEHIIRPDLMDTKKRPTAPGVWPYVGPVPVMRVPTAAVETPKDEAPKGLNALGKLASVIAGGPHVRGTISIRFHGSPARIGHFSVGSPDPIEEKPPPKDTEIIKKDAPKRRPGKYLTGVEHVGYEGLDDPVYRISYDEVTDPEKPAVAREERMVLSQSLLTGKPPALEFPPGSPEAAAMRPAGGPRVASSGPAPSRDSVRLTPVKTGANSFRIEPDDTAYRYLRDADVEKEILRDLKSEDVTDEKGGGVRVVGLEQDNILAKFDVQRGDILRSINGTPVHNRAQAIEVVKKLPKDVASVRVVVERNGVDRTYDIDPRDPAIRAAAGKVRFDGRK